MLALGRVDQGGGTQGLRGAGDGAVCGARVELVDAAAGYGGVVRFEGCGRPGRRRRRLTQCAGDAEDAAKGAEVLGARMVLLRRLEEQFGDALHRAGRRVKVIKHRTHMLADAVDVAAVESGVPSGPGGRGGRRACGDEAAGVVGSDVVLGHEELDGGGRPLDQGGIVAQQVGEGRCLV